MLILRRLGGVMLFILFLFLRLITRWHRFHRSMLVLLKTDTRYEWSIIRNEDSRCKIFPRFSVFSTFLQFYILIFHAYFQDSTWLLSSLAKSTKLLLLSTSVRLFNARYNQSYTSPKNFSLRRWSIKTRQITIDTFNIKYRNYEEIDGRIQIAIRRSSIKDIIASYSLFYRYEGKILITEIINNFFLFFYLRKVWTYIVKYRVIDVPLD